MLLLSRVVLLNYLWLLDMTRVAKLLLLLLGLLVGISLHLKLLHQLVEVIDLKV